MKWAWVFEINFFIAFSLELALELAPFRLPSVPFCISSFVCPKSEEKPRMFWFLKTFSLFSTPSASSIRLIATYAAAQKQIALELCGNLKQKFTQKWSMMRRFHTHTQHRSRNSLFIKPKWTTSSKRNKCLMVQCPQWQRIHSCNNTGIPLILIRAAIRNVQKPPTARRKCVRLYDAPCANLKPIDERYGMWRGSPFVYTYAVHGCVMESVRRAFKLNIVWKWKQKSFRP